jgi:signal transduction histidine kinase
VELDLNPTAEGPTPLQVRGDGHRLLGVFVNLAHNAIDAMRPTALGPDDPTGRARPRRLRIAARSVTNGTGTPSRAQLTFTDSGAGIANEIRATMFEPFVTTKRTGTGLGLAIARKVVEAHGGSIAALDAPGGGTTFAIELPLEHGRSGGVT